MPRDDKVDTKQRTCPICKRKFIGKPALVNHIEAVHSANIPEGWSAARYENYLRTGMTEGHCLYCGKPTGWNESTWKYHRICKDPKCRKQSAENAKKNMKNKYGKEHLLDDPEIQKKMIYSKRNSGTYYFEDPEDPSIRYPAQYDSSYAKDFLEMLDVMLNINGQDILAPSPNVYMYEYDGSTHFYIPDIYIVSLNLEVEIKDGGSHPNTHPKIVAIDKEKERLKDATMAKLKNKVNYIKIVDKDYTEFYTMLAKLKAEDNITYLPRYSKPRPVKEAYVNAGKMIKEQYKKSELLTHPVHSYTELMKILAKEVDRIDTPQKYAVFEFQLNNIEDHLKKVLNGHNEESERLKFETTKALKVIRDDIRPKLQRKKLKLQQKYPNEPIKKLGTPVEEAAIGDLLDETKYQPVYVFLSNAHTEFGRVIQWYTQEPYTHSSIAFNEKLSPMYSFMSKGFAIEDIKGGEYKKHEDVATFSLYAVMVKKEAAELMHNTCEEFRQHMEKYRYNILGCANLVVNFGLKERDDKWFCSEFVSYILKQGTDLFKNTSRLLIKPLDLIKDRRVVHIMHGKIRNYKPEKAREILVKKIREGKFDD